jgi:long-chain acyl-CoA synthetase
MPRPSEIGADPSGPIAIAAAEPLGQPEATTSADDAATFCDVFQTTAARFPDVVALRTMGGALEITWREYAERVRRLAAGLARSGVRRGDTVALMLTNRPEAYLVDTAAMHLGAVPFSIYNTSSVEQVEYLLRHANARVLITEAQFAERALAARPPACRGFSVDGPVGDLQPLSELDQTDFEEAEFEALWQSVASDDLLTLVYTSGTTGPPKGVELTHSSMLADWSLVQAVVPTRQCGRLLSYLPMAHLADRLCTHYAALLSGSTVTFVADARDLSAAMVEVRPTMFGMVPRGWEKLRGALLPAVAPSAEGGVDPALAERIRAQIGLDQVELLLSGAAPIAPEILEFFLGLGLEILEMWGMTETNAVATITPPGSHRVGSVGPPLPGIEIAQADDGELLVRGPTVMRGYRNDPQATAETLDADGWIHTGDIGVIDPDGYITIVDRKKELIISAGGKNMSPANIENAIKAACPLVGSAAAIGDGRPYNTALIVLDPDAAAAYAAAHAIDASTVVELASHPALATEIRAGIDRANRKLSRVEQIKKHTILPLAWEPSGDELTPTMKLKRKPIAAKYAAEIEAMYA